MNDSTPFDTVGDEPIEARIVAWVLGEASAFEAAELERLCEERPELLVFRRRMRALHGLLTEAEAAQPDDSWKLPEEKRKVLDEIFGEEKPARLEVDMDFQIRRSGRHALWAIAACVALTLFIIRWVKPGVFTPTMEMSQEAAQPSFAAVTKAREEELSELNKAVRNQEDKVEERRKVLSTIVRTKGVIYKGQDSFSGGAGVNEDLGAAVAGEVAKEETREESIKRGLDVQDYVDAKRDYESDQQLLQQLKLKEVEKTIALKTLPESLAMNEAGRAQSAQSSRSFDGSINYGSPIAGKDQLAFQDGSKMEMPAKPASADAKSVSAPEASAPPPPASAAPEITASFDSAELAQRDTARRNIAAPTTASGEMLPADAPSTPAVLESASRSRSSTLADGQDMAFRSSRAAGADSALGLEGMSALGRREGDKSVSGDRSDANLFARGAVDAPSEPEFEKLAKGSKPAQPSTQSAVGGKLADSEFAAGGFGGGGAGGEMENRFSNGSMAAADQETDALSSLPEPSAAPSKMPSRVPGQAHGAGKGFASGAGPVAATADDSLALEKLDAGKAISGPAAATDHYYSDSDRNGPVDEAGMKQNQAAVDKDGPVSDLTKTAEEIQTHAELLKNVDEARETKGPVEAEAKKELADARKPLGAIVNKAKADSKKSPLELMEEIAAAEEPYSTFSLNINDASFQIAKAALDKGERPDPTAIKVEQFYNAVDYGDPAPASNEPVAATIEQSAHPIIPGRNLVRVALKTAAAGRGASQPLRLTLLVDQSGSMVREDRRTAMSNALKQLGGLLTQNDHITVVGFSRESHLLADNLTGDQAKKLGDLVNQAASEGGTNLEQALNLGEQMAARPHPAGEQNRIVLFTDGAANLGNANPERLAERVKSLRQKGIAFDIAGIGADGVNDRLLSELARNGNGRYYVVSDEKNDSFARQLAGAFRPAAENVKVQVHFNPERVGNYKLIGFEKDRLKTEDFRNDAVDAAELAAEEAGVAIYQVETLPQGTGEIGEVSVRFRDTSKGEMVERKWTMPFESATQPFDRATPSMQLAGLSMLAADKLKGGPLADAIDFNQLTGPRSLVKQFYGGSRRANDMLHVIDLLK